MQKRVIFPEKEDARHFVYVPEFMLTLDEIQTISSLLCKKFEI